MLHIRLVTAAELAAIERQARSRTAAARAVERARIILLATQGERVAALAAQLGITEVTAR